MHNLDLAKNGARLQYVSSNFMTTQFGKYKVLESNNSFEIHYRYTFSDIVGSLIYLLSFILGLLLFYVSFKNFHSAIIVSIIFLIVGFILFFFGGYALIGSLYRPIRGMFQIDKIKKEIIIREFFKLERIKTDLVESISYDFIRSNKPKKVHSVLYIKLIDGKKKDCFIIRSSMPFDTGRELDKDIHSLSRQLRESISKVI